MNKNRWVQESINLQRELAKKVILETCFPNPIRYIAGVDVSNNPFDPKHMIYAAIVVLSYPALEVIEEATYAERQEMPYVPGLLGFRETPSLLKAYEQLSLKPDLMLVDGHGVSHPRGLGIASHLGILLDSPTIGVAKSILVGRPEGELSFKKGAQTPLIWKEKRLGMMLTTKKNCKPLIISSGHKIALEDAIDVVLDSLLNYRLPEPTRRAHLLANEFRKKLTT